MQQTLFIILAAIWTSWVLQAFLSAWRVRKFLSFISREPRNTFDRYRPPAAVIVPFKGIDTDLVSGVRGLCEQDYADYRLLLIVESKDDPAYEILTRETARYPKRKITILTAGPAGPNEGQKVHNQLHAIDWLLAHPIEKEAWVFADSDAVPHKQWLLRLVGPLCQPDHTGLSTGYRWLIPKENARVWSHLASVMNSSVACMFGRDSSNHAWGGSMAIRADVAAKCDLRGHLVGALCDDYQFTRAVSKIGLRTYFVPQCLVATPVDFTLKSLVNFAHRQYLLTRVYAPLLFVGSLFVHSLYFFAAISCVFCIAWASLAVLLDFRMAGDVAPKLVLFTCITACVLSELGNHLRSTFRRRVVRQAFGEEVERKLSRTLRWDRWLTFVWMFLHQALVVHAMFGSTMNWRGIRYRLHGPQRVTRL